MTWVVKVREKLTIRSPRDLLRVIGYAILLFVALVFGPLIILALIVLGAKALLIGAKLPDKGNLMRSVADKARETAERKTEQQ